MHARRCTAHTFGVCVLSCRAPSCSSGARQVGARTCQCLYKKAYFLKKKMEDLVLSCLESRVEGNKNLYARFLIGPFFKGDALTVATALRRVLLSSVESIVITALYLQGITHEFSSIVGVRESVLELSLNFQSVVLCYDKKFYQKKSFFDDLQIGYLQVQGPKVVYANDLKLPLGVKVVDPTQYIATVSREGVLVLKFTLGKVNNSLSQNSSFHTSAPTTKQAISQQLLKKNIVKAKKKCSYKNVYALNPNLYFYPSIKRFVRTTSHTYGVKPCFDGVIKSNRFQKLMSGASFVQQKTMQAKQEITLSCRACVPLLASKMHGNYLHRRCTATHKSNRVLCVPLLAPTEHGKKGTGPICERQEGARHAKHSRSNTGVMMCVRAMQSARTYTNCTGLRSPVFRSPRLSGGSPKKLLPIGFAKAQFSPLGFKNIFTNNQSKPKFALHFLVSSCPGVAVHLRCKEGHSQHSQGFVCRVSNNKEKLGRRAKHNLYKSFHRFTSSSKFCRAKQSLTFSKTMQAKLVCAHTCPNFCCAKPRSRASSCPFTPIAVHLLVPHTNLRFVRGKKGRKDAWHVCGTQQAGATFRGSRRFVKVPMIDYPKDDRSTRRTNEKQVSSAFLPKVLHYKSLVCVHAKRHNEAVTFARQKPICKWGTRRRVNDTLFFSSKKFLKPCAVPLLAVSRRGKKMHGKAKYSAKFVMYKHARKKINFYGSVTSNVQSKSSQKIRLFGTASTKVRANGSNNLTNNRKFSTQSIFLYNDNKSRCKLIKPMLAKLDCVPPCCARSCAYAHAIDAQPIKKEKFYVFSNLFVNRKVNNPKLLEKVFPSDICLRNIIPLDSPLPPVLKVNFLIEIDDEVLYLRQKIRERIILEVWTNGSVHPRQAVHDATLSLLDIFSTFRSLYQINQYSSPLLKVPEYAKNYLPLTSVNV